MTLCFRSDKPLAKDFRRWVTHEVLPAIRKTGKYATAGAENAPAHHSLLLAEIAQWRERALADPRFALEKVRTAQRLYGKVRARLVWDQLGLLKVPELPEPSPLGDAFACLRHLLGWTLKPGILVRDAIRDALDGSDEYELFLKAHGMRTRERPQVGFFVANTHPQVQDIFLDTEWSKGQWPYALRKLPGAKVADKMRFGDQMHRGTFIPERYLDERFPSRPG